MGAGHEIVVVGAGGNIGSHLVPHLARLAGVRGVRLIDPDVYEERNRTGQAISPGDVGRPKAVVQAERLRRIAPALAVRAAVDRVEHVPLGWLRAAVILACLDSRAARRLVAEAGWRLGVPVVDSGVNADGLLARVTVWVPGPERPCLQCGWDDGDYETLEQAYPCADGAPEPAPTNAPSALGALAAALQALECEKLLAGAWDDVAVARQVAVAARRHALVVTGFRPNARCAFDHGTWEVERLGGDPAALGVAEVLERGRRAIGGDGPLRLGVASQPFARALHCPVCGEQRDVALRLVGRLGAAERTCARCGGRMRPGGLDLLDWLPAEETAARTPLHRLGVLPGDVLTVAGAGRAAHFEIGGVA